MERKVITDFAWLRPFVAHALVTMTMAQGPQPEATDDVRLWLRAAYASFSSQGPYRYDDPEERHFLRLLDRTRELFRVFADGAHIFSSNSAAKQLLNF